MSKYLVMHNSEQKYAGYKIQYDGDCSPIAVVTSKRGAYSLINELRGMESQIEALQFQVDKLTNILATEGKEREQLERQRDYLCKGLETKITKLS